MYLIFLKIIRFIVIIICFVFLRNLIMSEAIVIAVDGPAGAGKGELTRRLAEV